MLALISITIPRILFGLLEQSSRLRTLVTLLGIDVSIPLSYFDCGAEASNHQVISSWGTPELPMLCIVDPAI